LTTFSIILRAAATASGVLGDATQTYLAVGGGWQHDIIRLNARELFEHGSWGIAETSAALPHLEALPQYEGEKADEDMCLHAILALVPDRTKVELVLLDAESGFGLRQLDIGLPELLIAPIVDIRTQQIGALRDRGPVVEGVVVNDAKAETRGTAIRRQRDCEACGGSLVLLLDAANLPVHNCRIDTLLRTSQARSQALERFFDPLAELVVHGLLFTAPIGGAAQDHGLLVSGWRASLTSTPSWTVRHPSAAASAELNFFSSDFGAPMM